MIQQIVEIRGVAFTENFATYKLEISGDFTGGQFATMESYTQPVTTLGSLSQFNPAIYAEGTYQFRLAVFDISDTLRESCAALRDLRSAACPDTHPRRAGEMSWP